MTVAADAATSATAEPGARRRRRSLHPRFSMRTLLIAGLIASLLLGWLGRSLYRVRQEDAAIEALLQAGAGISLHDLQGDYFAANAELKASRHATIASQLARAFGRGERPKIVAVTLQEGTADVGKLQAAARGLDRLPEIERTTLWGACFDDEDCRSLSTLPRLATVSLRDTNVSGAGVASLAAAPALREVTISDPLSAGSLDGVSRLTQLRRLILFNSYVSSEQMQGVASLPDLEYLALVAVVPRDAGAFPPLAESKSVESLDIEYCRLTERDLQAIAAMPCLAELDLTVKSDWNLMPLADARGLRTLGLSSEATMESVRELSARLPGCRVRSIGVDAARGSFVDGRPADDDEGDSVVEEAAADESAPTGE